MKQKNILAVLVAAGLVVPVLSPKAQQDTSPPASPSQSDVSRQDNRNQPSTQDEQRRSQHNLPAGQEDRDTVQSQQPLSSGTQSIRDYNRTSDTNSVAASMQSYHRVSQIIGHEVRDSQGQRLGKVHDLVINLSSPSSPVVAIIGYGGALGIGETRVAVPLNELRWSGDDKTLSMSVSKDQLQSAPQTRSGGWAMIGGDDWAKNVDRFYGDISTSSMAGSQQPSSTLEGRQYVRDPAIQTNQFDSSRTSPNSSDDSRTRNPSDR